MSIKWGKNPEGHAWKVFASLIAPLDILLAIQTYREHGITFFSIFTIIAAFVILVSFVGIWLKDYDKE